MSEETLWSGTSSQMKNLGPFILCLILLAVTVAVFLLTPLGPLALLLLLIPLPWALYRWLTVKTTTYRLTTERLLTEQGIFNKVTNTLELYRVRDMQVTAPFFQRLCGLQTIELITADTSTPTLEIDAVPASLGLADKLRAQVEECRMRKRVRSLDVEGGDADFH